VKPKRPIRREIFVLTPEEKRIICFVLAMFVLGFATVRYRTNHSTAPPKIAVNETASATDRPAQKRAESKRPRPMK
jgi:hypothetical protein